MLPEITFVADYSLLIGGKERQLIEMVKYLNYYKISWRIIMLSGIGLLYQEFKIQFPSQIILIDRKQNKIPYIIRNLRVCLYNNINIPIIHACDNLAVMLLVIATLGKKKILINGSIRHAGAARGFDYLLEYLFLKISDVVIANSMAGLKKFGLQRKGYVIYNFINLNRFRSCNNNLRNIVMTANFSKMKDHNTFINVCLKLISEGRIENVGLIGDGPEKHKIQEITSKTKYRENFKYYGQDDKVEDILMGYGIGVLCSTKKYREGVSNSILEYMGAGLIAIASNIGGTSEIIENGFNGFLFEGENVNSLYQQIIYIQDHSAECDNIRANALTTLKQKFDADKNCKLLLNIYESVYNKC
ncbi:MAG: glycosyltransferase family 4 protein [Methanobacterium sp.]